VATFDTSDGIALWYDTSGTGPRLYTCAGGPAGDHRYLAEDLTPLEGELELVHHDYRGSGQSQPAPAETYSFERIADDLDELRAALDDDQIDLLGHSMGGFVALTYALRHPERCRRLILAGSCPTTDPRVFVRPTLRALGWARTLKMLSRSLWWLGAYSWRRPSLTRTRRLYAIWATTQEGRRDIRAGEIAREERLGLPLANDNVPALQRAFRSLRFTAELPRVQCPVLVLYGDRDAMAAATVHQFRDGLPDVKVVALPDIGHDPFFEAPAAALDTVRAFLR
jgi:pimeloyl-ACP methyl ester carboxylesterase